MKSLPSGFKPNKAMIKFLNYFLYELDLRELNKLDLTTLALRAGVSPLKVRKWFKSNEFKKWFYEETDEIFSLMARIVAKDLLERALRGDGDDKLKMFIVKLFLDKKKYVHEYKSDVDITVKKTNVEKDTLYTDYEIIKNENQLKSSDDDTNEKDDLV